MVKFQAIVRRFALFSITLLTPPSGQTAEGTQKSLRGGGLVSLLGNISLIELCNGYQFLVHYSRIRKIIKILCRECEFGGLCI